MHVASTKGSPGRRGVLTRLALLVAVAAAAVLALGATQARAAEWKLNLSQTATNQETLPNGNYIIVASSNQALACTGGSTISAVEVTGVGSGTSIDLTDASAASSIVWTYAQGAEENQGTFSNNGNYLVINNGALSTTTDGGSPTTGITATHGSSTYTLKGTSSTYELKYDNSFQSVESGGTELSLYAVDDASVTEVTVAPSTVNWKGIQEHYTFIEESVTATVSAKNVFLAKDLEISLASDTGLFSVGEITPSGSEGNKFQATLTPQTGYGEEIPGSVTVNASLVEDEAEPQTAAITLTDNNPEITTTDESLSAININWTGYAGHYAYSNGPTFKASIETNQYVTNQDGLTVSVEPDGLVGPDKPFTSIDIETKSGSPYSLDITPNTSYSDDLPTDPVTVTVAVAGENVPESKVTQTVTFVDANPVVDSVSPAKVTFDYAKLSNGNLTFSNEDGGGQEATVTVTTNKFITNGTEDLKVELSQSQQSSYSSLVTLGQVTAGTQGDTENTFTFTIQPQSSFQEAMPTGPLTIEVSAAKNAIEPAPEPMTVEVSFNKVAPTVGDWTPKSFDFSYTVTGALDSEEYDVSPTEQQVTIETKNVLDVDDQLKLSVVDEKGDIVNGLFENPTIAASEAEGASEGDYTITLKPATEFNTEDIDLSTASVSVRVTTSDAYWDIPVKFTQITTIDLSNADTAITFDPATPTYDGESITPTLYVGETKLDPTWYTLQLTGGPVGGPTVTNQPSVTNAGTYSWTVTAVEESIFLTGSQSSSSEGNNPYVVAPADAPTMTAALDPTEIPYGATSTLTVTVNGVANETDLSQLNVTVQPLGADGEADGNYTVTPVSSETTFDKGVGTLTFTVEVAGGAVWPVDAATLQVSMNPQKPASTNYAGFPESVSVPVSAVPASAESDMLTLSMIAGEPGTVTSPIPAASPNPANPTMITATFPANATLNSIAATATFSPGANATWVVTDTVPPESADSYATGSSPFSTSEDAATTITGVNLEEGAKYILIQVTAQDATTKGYYVVTVEQSPVSAGTAVTEVTYPEDMTQADQEALSGIDGTSLDKASQDAMNEQIITQVSQDSALNDRIANNAGSYTTSEAGDGTIWGDLKNENPNIPDRELNYFYVPQMDVDVESYQPSQKSLTVNITPYYTVIATTATTSRSAVLPGADVPAATVNAVVIGEQTELDLTNVTVDIQLPAIFAVGSQVYVQHVPDGTDAGSAPWSVYLVTAGPQVSVFAESFSIFNIQADPQGEAYIGTTVYPTVQDAINALDPDSAEPQTIVLTSTATAESISGLYAPATEVEFKFEMGGSQINVGNIELQPTVEGDYVYTAKNTNGTVVVTKESLENTDLKPASIAVDEATVSVDEGKSATVTFTTEGLGSGTTYKAVSSAPTVATAEISATEPSTITVNGLAEGEATVTVSVVSPDFEDDYIMPAGGLNDTFSVTVNASGEVPAQAIAATTVPAQPVAGQAITSITLKATGCTFSADATDRMFTFDGAGKGTLAVTAVTVNEDGTATLSVSGVPAEGTFTVTAAANAFEPVLGEALTSGAITVVAQSTPPTPGPGSGGGGGTTPVPPEQQPTRDDLQGAVDDATAKYGDANDGRYTDESWAAYQAALESAQAVLADPDATQAEVSDALAALNSAIAALVPAQQPEPETVDVYRVLNPDTQEHLYTKDPNEYAYLTTQAGWEGENVAWTAPTSSSTPIYRLRHPGGGHLYTTSLNEYNYLDQHEAWVGEGIALYSAPATDSVPIYRLYHPGYFIGFSHLWTADFNEYTYQGSHGWNQEDVAFYAITAPGM